MYWKTSRISVLHFQTLFSTQPFNLVAEEITRNKSVVQTLILFFQSPILKIKKKNMCLSDMRAY